MTPKEKAEELVHGMFHVDKYDDYSEPTMYLKHAIKCALKAVDEIIKELLLNKISVYYWQDVKKEIEKL